MKKLILIVYIVLSYFIGVHIGANQKEKEVQEYHDEINQNHLDSFYGVTNMVID